MKIQVLSLRLWFVAMALVLLSVGSAVAVPISGVSIDSVSSTYPGFSPDNVINGNGLNTAVAPNTHSAAPDLSLHWETMYYQNSAWIVFDLNALFNVDEMRVWNFNYINPNGDYSGRGFKDVSISTSANHVDWTVQGNFEFPHATDGDLYTGTLFSSLGWDGIRYVRFDASSIWGYGDVGGHFGLSEVRFYEGNTPTEVPEPTSLILLGIGALAAARRSRKE